MANHHLRATILRLLDRLSDYDRKRLHFFLANEVPRSIGDDPSLNGTLNLMKSLFDQAKISEENCNLLIHAFSQIQCVEAVKLLNEHKKSLQASWINQPNLTSAILPLNHEIVQDQEEEEEDKSSSQYLLNQMNNCVNNNKTYDNNNTNINPVTINVDNKKIVASMYEENQPFYISFKINKYLLCIILFILMVIGICLSIFIVNIYKLNKLERKMKDENILEEQNRENQRLEFMNNFTSENVQITNQFKQPQQENDDLIIKAGKIFGRSDGFDFDDSSLSNFTYLHYLFGLNIRENKDGLETYQFRYYSPTSNQRPLTSQFHGNADIDYKVPFDFMKDDKIKRVQGRLVNKIILHNGKNLTKVYITGLEFTSENHINSPRYRNTLGEIFTEEYDGYTLGYVTGKSREYIEQLKFFWYRSNNKI